LAQIFGGPLCANGVGGGNGARARSLGVGGLRQASIGRYVRVVGAEIVPYGDRTVASSVPSRIPRRDAHVGEIAYPVSLGRTQSLIDGADLQGRGRRFDPCSAYHLTQYVRRPSVFIEEVKTCAGTLRAWGCGESC